MLIKQTLLYLPSQLLSPLAQFMSILLWTYYCDSVTIGIITLITTQQELIRTVIMGWWSHFALRFINDDKLSAQGMAASNVGVVFFASLLQLVAAYLTFLYIFSDDGNIYHLIVTVAFIVFRSINQHNVNLAAAKNNALAYNILSLCGPVVGLVIGIILLDFFGDDALYPLAGYALGESLGVLYSLYKAKQYLSPFKMSQTILLASMKYGLPILISGALAWVALNISRYIIESKMGLAAVGSYAVGFGLGQRAAGIAAMLVTSAALPLAISVMQKQGKAKAMQQLSDNFTLLMAVMFPALVGMYAVNDLLVKLLIAPEFWDVTLDILPYSILSGGLFAIIYNYLNHYFIVAEKTKYLIIVDGTLALLICLLSFPLVDLIGLKGGVVAMCIASAVVLFGLLIYLLVNTDFVFPWRSFAYTCIAVGGMYLFVIFIRRYFDSLVTQLIMSILLGGSVYILFIAYYYRDRLFSFTHQRLKRG